MPRSPGDRVPLVPPALKRLQNDTEIHETNIKGRRFSWPLLQRKKFSQRCETNSVVSKIGHLKAEQQTSFIRTEVCSATEETTASVSVDAKSETPHLASSHFQNIPDDEKGEKWSTKGGMWENSEGYAVSAMGALSESSVGVPELECEEFIGSRSRDPSPDETTKKAEAAPRRSWPGKSTLVGFVTNFFKLNPRRPTLQRVTYALTNFFSRMCARRSMFSTDDIEMESKGNPTLSSKRRLESGTFERFDDPIEMTNGEDAFSSCCSTADLSTASLFGDDDNHLSDDIDDDFEVPFYNDKASLIEPDKSSESECGSSAATTASDEMLGRENPRKKRRRHRPRRPSIVSIHINEKKVISPIPRPFRQRRDSLNLLSPVGLFRAIKSKTKCSSLSPKRPGSAPSGHQRMRSRLEFLDLSQDETRQHLEDNSTPQAEFSCSKHQAGFTSTPNTFTGKMSQASAKNKNEDVFQETQIRDKLGSSEEGTRHLSQSNPFNNSYPDSGRGSTFSKAACNFNVSAASLSASCKYGERPNSEDGIVRLAVHTSCEKSELVQREFLACGDFCGGKVDTTGPAYTATLLPKTEA